MLRNYIKVAIRNLFKDSFYSSINIFGLSIGITTCLLILLYVNHELSYDKFHKGFDRIYRVTAKAKLAGSEVTMAVSSPPLAERLSYDLEEVEAITRLLQLHRVIKHNDNLYREDDMLYADSTFFDVFSFDVLRGDPGTMLRDPYSIVMTEEAAVRYFSQAGIDEGRFVSSTITLPAYPNPSSSQSFIGFEVGRSGPNSATIYGFGRSRSGLRQHGASRRALIGGSRAATANRCVPARPSRSRAAPPA